MHGQEDAEANKTAYDRADVMAMLETDSILTGFERAVAVYCPLMLYGWSRSFDGQETTAMDFDVGQHHNGVENVTDSLEPEL